MGGLVEAGECAHGDFECHAGACAGLDEYLLEAAELLNGTFYIACGGSGIELHNLGSGDASGILYGNGYFGDDTVKRVVGNGILSCASHRSLGEARAAIFERRVAQAVAEGEAYGNALSVVPG